MWQALTALFGSYLLGSLPTGYLVVRAATGLDVRTRGSGNVGATNVARVAGSRAGLVVFLMDLAKGLAATLLIPAWLNLPEALWVHPDSSPAPSTVVVGLACGLAAVLGHSFPVWLRFRGGKGVATTIGVVLGTAPLSALVVVGVWGICAAIWRYVSVASMAAAVALPIAQVWCGRSLPEVLLGAALGLVIVVRHRTNLQRLFHGREPRLGTPRSPT
jgi:glycerol-3-phosphate acyltransferase PlsY